MSLPGMDRPGPNWACKANFLWKIQEKRSAWLPAGYRREMWARAPHSCHRRYYPAPEGPRTTPITSMPSIRGQACTMGVSVRARATLSVVVLHERDARAYIFTARRFHRFDTLKFNRSSAGRAGRRSSRQSRMSSTWHIPHPLCGRCWGHNPDRNPVRDSPG